ncbi:MAG TPA: universal stress protein [Gemmatimonadaceae bacterium]
MYRHIMVPLDGTAASQHAVPWAFALARKAESSIDLVRVIPTAFGAEPYGTTVLNQATVDQMRIAAREMLRDLAEEMTEKGVPSRAIVIDGEVRDALRSHLESDELDLIVMTTHDAGRVERFLIGSVAESLVRNVRCPVLLIRADSDDIPQFDDVRTVARIVVPLDGSEFAEEVLPHAITFGRCFQSEMALMAVIQPVVAIATMAADVAGPNVIATLPPAKEADPDPDEVTTYSDVLERAARRVRDAGLTVSTAVLVDTRPAHAIVDYADRHDADLIAMTTHGRGALKRLVAGSVSRGVLLGTQKPMLVYRPEKVGR